MTFASSSLTIEIEVTSTSLMGQLVPAHAREVFLSLHDGTGRPVPVDELGAFTIDPIPQDRFLPPGRRRTTGEHPLDSAVATRCRTRARTQARIRAGVLESQSPSSVPINGSHQGAGGRHTAMNPECAGRGRR